MKLSPLLLTALILLLTAAMVQDAFAQFGGMGSGIGGGGFGGSRAGHGGGGRNSGNQAGINNQQSTKPDPNTYEQIEYRLSQLQDSLKLSPGQTGLWQSFADSTLAYIRDRSQEGSSSTEAYSVTPSQTLGLQSIGQAVDVARNHLATIQEVETSAKALYQAFTPEQKAVADLRIPTIITPQRMGASVNTENYGLPDLGSSP